MRLAKLMMVGAALWMASSAAWAQVTILINKQPYEFAHPVRLSSVLSIAANGGDWYWPASGVFDLNDATAEREKEAVLSRIRELLTEYDADSSTYKLLKNMYTQVASWTVATRVTMPVSYTRARVFFEENPMFPAGKYLLRLTGRPSVVHFSGAVAKPGAYRHSNNAIYTVSDKVKNHPEADRSTVYVIAPNGEVSERGIAYWNIDYGQLIPGSQVYVPIQGQIIGHALDDLNQRIAKLAVHRILPQ